MWSRMNVVSNEKVVCERGLKWTWSQIKWSQMSRSQISWSQMNVVSNEWSQMNGLKW